ncbi:MAG: cyclic nucleotide-binding domain-containing protein [Chloroflexia bacterium]|nr:cyclic nucleotide-binding domain-containing protein [Chloroflexia bacterium]
MIEVTDLKQVELFEGLTEEQLPRIAAIGQEEHYVKDQVIFRENTPGNCMYIVLDGEIEIQVDPGILGEDQSQDKPPFSITLIRRGQNFGEVALVDQGVRSASAICHSRQAQLFSIPRDAFLQLCEEDLAMGYRVMFHIAADLSSRIRTTDFYIRGRLLLAPRE